MSKKIFEEINWRKIARSACKKHKKFFDALVCVDNKEYDYAAFLNIGGPTTI